MMTLAVTNYRRHLLEVVQTSRSYGIAAPFMIALCTLCGAPHPNAENVRAGQRASANIGLGTFLGLDTLVSATKIVSVVDTAIPCRDSGNNEPATGEDKSNTDGYKGSQCLRQIDARQAEPDNAGLSPADLRQSAN